MVKEVEPSSNETSGAVRSQIWVGGEMFLQVCGEDVRLLMRQEMKL